MKQVIIRVFIILPENPTHPEGLLNQSLMNLLSEWVIQSFGSNNKALPEPKVTVEIRDYKEQGGDILL